MINYIKFTMSLFVFTSCAALASTIEPGEGQGGNPPAKVYMPSNQSQADVTSPREGLKSKKDQEVLSANIRAHTKKEMRKEEAKRKADKEKLDAEMAELNSTIYKIKVLISDSIGVQWDKNSELKKLKEAGASEEEIRGKEMGLNMLQAIQAAYESRLVGFSKQMAELDRLAKSMSEEKTDKAQAEKKSNEESSKRQEQNSARSYSGN